MSADYKPQKASVPSFTDFSELMKAAKQCTKNVGWKENVTRWMADAMLNVIKLKAELDNKTYHVSPAHVFHIEDPKPRTISATRFRDRVVQRSICNNGAYEKLTKGLIYDNCACQKGKGVTFAIARLEEHLRRHFVETGSAKGFIVRLDVRKYFPSIPHSLLKESLKAVKLEPYAQELVFQMIDNIVNIKQDCDLSFLSQSFGARGIGLGSQLSQLMALYYLSPLDHMLKEKLHIKHYLRYMDDMIMIVRTREEAEKAYSAVESFLAPYGLNLNPKSHICSLDGEFEFLKMKFKLTSTGKVRHKIVRKSLNKEVRMLNSLCRQFKEQKISYEKLLQHTNTWFGYAKHRASRNQIKFISKLLKEQFKEFKKIHLSAK